MYKSCTVRSIQRTVVADLSWWTERGTVALTPWRQQNWATSCAGFCGFVFFLDCFYFNHFSVTSASQPKWRMATERMKSYQKCFRILELLFALTGSVHDPIFFFPSLSCHQYILTLLLVSSTSPFIVFLPNIWLKILNCHPDCTFTYGLVYIVR